MYCSQRRAQLLNLFTEVKASCGHSAGVTLGTLTAHLHTLYTLIRLNGTHDNCTHGKFTVGHLASVTLGTQTVTLGTLTAHLHTLYTLIRLNGSHDNCTHGKFTVGHLAGVTLDTPTTHG